MINKPIADHLARPHLRKLSSWYTFRSAIDAIYQMKPEYYANIPDNSIICRCEDISAADIRKAIIQGTYDINDIKKRTRIGIGHCQGCNCMSSVAGILTYEYGLNMGLSTVMHSRPPVRPISINLLLQEEGSIYPKSECK